MRTRGLLLSLIVACGAVTAPLLGQEVTGSADSGSVLGLLLGGGEEGAPDDGELGPGQWTRRDRMLGTERFRQAMEYIATQDRTDLLGKDHMLLAAYYSFLADHSVVRAAGLRWPRVAGEVVTDLAAANAAVRASDTVGGLVGILSHDGQDRTLSPVAREFLDGTASALVAGEATRLYFGPLLRGETTVDEGGAFRFDAEVLRHEQFHPEIQAYYDGFTESDLRWLDGFAARLYAARFDFDSYDKYSLTSARDRLYLGLRRMGYPEDRIDGYLRDEEIE